MGTVLVGRKCLETRGAFAMIFMDLPKVYNCLNHDILIVKLDAYEFGLSSLRMLQATICHEKNRLKFTPIIDRDSI